MLSFHLLGTPRIQRDGESINIIRRKSRALVYYLAAHDKPLTRDHLIAFFWPDLERAAAQQTLRTTLHGLRRLLGSAPVVDEDTLALAPDTDVDTHLFQSRLSSPITNLQSLLFIGRAAELEELRIEASSEPHKLLLIEGEPGIGKTRLAEMFISSSGTRGLAGRAREPEKSPRTCQVFANLS